MHIYRKWELKLGDGRQIGHMSLDVVVVTEKYDAKQVETNGH